MKCFTVIDAATGKLCGHSITAHDGDESGMGGAEPCGYVHCPCNNFTREPVRVESQDDAAPPSFALPHLPMASTYNSGPFLVKVDGGIVITTTTVQFIPDGMHVPTEQDDPGLDSAGTETLSETDFDVYEGE